MSEDLLSLRLLMVGASHADRSLWALGAARASVPIEFVAQEPIASGIPQSADVVVVDGRMSEIDIAAVVQAVRTQRPTALVVVCGANGAARLPGLDGLLPRPTSVEEARQVANRCVRACLPKHVLIVDDSSTMRSIVRKILSGSRFRLEIEDSADGKTALLHVRAGRFGLVFVDYNMPGFNGIETLKEIRRLHEEVAVVLMTSSLDAALAERARAAGAFAFLKKPFYPADIDAILERYYGLNG